ncbi:MAG: Rieske 2Fe-2S domain-containing protein [Anaerolineae bacterium]|nr:Rieske 2Fe-2S domain-containing protein [Anaerolineae bacterium]
MSLTKTLDKTLEGIPTLPERADQLSKTVHKYVLAGGEPVRSAVDGLHGTWLGHPLHPLLTDVVIGAWLMGALFDLLSLKDKSPAAEQAADTLTIVGALAAVPTAAAGVADYSTIPKSAAGTALVHAVVNNISLSLYVLSWRTRKKGQRSLGILLSLLGFVVLGLGAFLGGHLSFGKKVGVNRTTAATKPSKWTAIVAEAELGQHQPKRVEVEGQPWLLYRQGENVYATSAICPHAEGPLEEGQFCDLKVQCPWHNSVFDLRDGRVVHGPSTYPLPRYEARVRNGKIEVRVPPS